MPFETYSGSRKGRGNNILAEPEGVLHQNGVLTINKAAVNAGLFGHVLVLYDKDTRTFGLMPTTEDRQGSRKITPGKSRSSISLGGALYYFEVETELPGAFPIRKTKIGNDDVFTFCLDEYRPLPPRKQRKRKTEEPTEEALQPA